MSSKSSFPIFKQVAPAYYDYKAYLNVNLKFNLTQFTRWDHKTLFAGIDDERTFMSCFMAPTSLMTVHIGVSSDTFKHQIFK